MITSFFQLPVGGCFSIAYELQLYAQDHGTVEGKGKIIASYHRSRLLFKRRKSFVELYPGHDAYPDLLDMIVCAYPRRDLPGIITDIDRLVTLLSCARRRRLHEWGLFGIVMII